jgi:hypothetical protein
MPLRLAAELLDEPGGTNEAAQHPLHGLTMHSYRKR